MFCVLVSEFVWVSLVLSVYLVMSVVFYVCGFTCWSVLAAVAGLCYFSVLSR